MTWAIQLELEKALEKQLGWKALVKQYILKDL